MICAVPWDALRIECQDHGYDRIDIAGVRSDSGAAARRVAARLSNCSLCGCLAHEAFKAQRRNKS